ncbi:ABC transporter ATP-binding protein [Ihuprevotella massiliensis]|uniref:ABC transporter ATP-binding protein n=1 Tax=Ihuprevotella massiliensis TaxID=1852368 RepID=UPI00094E33BC
MISLRNIHKSFGNLEVLKGIDLDIQKGEMVSIVGPSGAGKTTLLQIMGTLDRPNEGTLTIANTDVTRLSSSALSHFRNTHIGFIFQFHQLLPEFTALENVMMPALIAGTSKRAARERATQLLAYMGLEDRAEHKPAALSGGEKQRVAAARALMNEPDIIFADEPTGSLDSKNRAELQELFFQLRRDLGQTFVIVTHDETFAQQCDRCIHMVDGRISDEATTEVQQTSEASLEADEDNHTSTDTEATAALHLTAPMSDYPLNLAE